MDINEFLKVQSIVDKEEEKCLEGFKQHWPLLDTICERESIDAANPLEMYLAFHACLTLKAMLHKREYEKLIMSEIFVDPELDDEEEVD